MSYPFAASLAIDIPPEIGRAMVEKMKMTKRSQTKTDGLPVALTTASVAIIPINEPVAANMAIHIQ